MISAPTARQVAGVTDRHIAGRMSGRPVIRNPGDRCEPGDDVAGDTAMPSMMPDLRRCTAASGPPGRAAWPPHETWLFTGLAGRATTITGEPASAGRAGGRIR